jgi:hypothetical protein
VGVDRHEERVLVVGIRPQERMGHVPQHGHRLVFFTTTGLLGM